MIFSILVMALGVTYYAFIVSSMSAVRSGFDTHNAALRQKTIKLENFMRYVFQSRSIFFLNINFESFFLSGIPTYPWHFVQSYVHIYIRLRSTSRIAMKQMKFLNLPENYTGGVEVRVDFNNGYPNVVGMNIDMKVRLKK